jgi:hypothetical protein
LESISDKHFILFSIHYLENYQFKTRVLHCEEITEEHITHKVISKIFKNLFEKYPIQKKIPIVTSDGGGNLVKALEELGFEILHCFGHATNLCVTDNLSIINEIKSRVKEICKIFNQNQVARRTLNNIQRKDNEVFDFTDHCYSIINEVNTRWWSINKMFKRINLLWDNINDTFDKLNKSNLKITDEELNIINELILIFDILEKSSELLCGDTYTTSSFLIPTIYSIKIQINNLKLKKDIPNKFKKGIEESIEIRFNEYLKNEILLTSTFLNPLFKILIF